MTHQFVIDKLRSLNVEQYCIVDVGCRGGDLVKLMKPNFQAKYIGIDPSPNTGHPLYDEFYQVAIDDVSSPETRQFYIYSNEPGCNSLLPMRKDMVTHDLEEYDSKWYVGWDIEKNEEVVSVTAISLSDLLKSSQVFNDVQYLHFLKVDAQGKDINVVKSLGDIIKKTYMVQIESTVHSDTNVSLYHGQQHYLQDVEDMKSMGFVQAHIIDYSVDKNQCPEADVIFINTKLFSV